MYAHRYIRVTTRLTRSVHTSWYVTESVTLRLSHPTSRPLRVNLWPPPARWRPAPRRVDSPSSPSPRAPELSRRSSTFSPVTRVLHSRLQPAPAAVLVTPPRHRAPVDPRSAVFPAAPPPRGGRTGCERGARVFHGPPPSAPYMADRQPVADRPARTDEQTDEPDKRTDERTDERIDERINKRIDERIDGRRRACM